MKDIIREIKRTYPELDLLNMPVTLLLWEGMIVDARTTGKRENSIAFSVLRPCFSKGRGLENYAYQLSGMPGGYYDVSKLHEAKI